MSRTKSRGVSASPIKKYLQFSASTGLFSYYDKEAKNKVELEELKLTVLDVRSSVTGYNSANKAQVASNMVAQTGKEELKVVSWKDGKATEIAEGLYKDIKEKVTSKSVGGKFTANVICLCDVGKGKEICNLQFSGSSLNGWINFLSSLDAGGEYDNEITISRGALSVVDGKEFRPVTKKEEDELDKALAKNKRHPQPIWFYVLAFDTEELTEEQVEFAGEEDDKLQKFFETTSGVKSDKAPSAGTGDDTPEEEEGEVEEEGDDNVPF